MLFMRNRHLLHLAAAAVAVACLTACAGGGSPAASSSLPASALGRSHVLPDIARSGISPKFFNLERARGTVIHPERQPRMSPKDLFVSDGGSNAVDVLSYPSWSYYSDITSGIDGPDGNWVDTNGNLYIANYLGINITEYNSSGAPIYTYSNGIEDPVNVSTDKNGNVYEADFYGNYVNEYAQQSNTVLYSCAAGGYVEGVAVDQHGDVFVDYWNGQMPGNVGYIVEYPRGLSGCNATLLGATVSFPGGMVLDKSDNLIICDQGGPTVDIIAPPYNAVTTTLGSGYSDPFHVTINRARTQAYVADYSTGNVYVMPYPAGAPITTLGSGNGINFAWSAVDGKNYVR
jgi:hypothetical protein